MAAPRCRPFLICFQAATAPGPLIKLVLNNSPVAIHQNCNFGALSGDPMAASLYEYNALENRHIRLFTLHAGAADDTITGSIKHVRVDDHVPYEALSYTWGDPDLKHNIFIDYRNALPITDNLYLALRKLRLLDRPRDMWIDAICINQNDIPERNAQVQLMRLIYSRSQLTIVFLGDDHGQSASVATTMSKLVSSPAELFQNMDVWDTAKGCKALGLPPENHADWNLVREFLDLPWFRRAWVLQEVVVSPRVSMIWGELAFSFDEVVLVAWRLAGLGKILEVDEGNRPQVKRDYIDPDGSVGSQRLLAMRTVQIAGDLRDTKTKNIVSTLRSLLLLARYLKATDAKDHVYAVLGLAKESGDESLQPNYQKSLESTYAHFTKYLMMQPRGLELLCWSGTALSSLSLPSWIPDWSSSRSSFRSVTFTAFDLIQEITGTFFSAGLTWPPKFSFSESSKMTINGASLDSIASVVFVDEKDYDKPILYAFNWLEKSRKLAQNVKMLPPGQSQCEVLWRTLMANGSMDWERPGADIDIAFHMFAIEVGHAARETTNAKYKSYEEEHFAFTAAKRLLAMKRVYPHISSSSFRNSAYPYASYRRVALTSKGNFALVPLGTRKDDMICIFFGSPVAHILRPSSGSGEYELVGDCYLHGFMDGEAVKLGLEPQDFVLV